MRSGPRKKILLNAGLMLQSAEASAAAPVPAHGHPAQQAALGEGLCAVACTARDGPPQHHARHPDAVMRPAPRTSTAVQLQPGQVPAREAPPACTNPKSSGLPRAVLPQQVGPSRQAAPTAGLSPASCVTGAKMVGHGGGGTPAPQPLPGLQAPRQPQQHPANHAFARASSPSAMPGTAADDSGSRLSPVALQGRQQQACGSGHAAEPGHRNVHTRLCAGEGGGSGVSAEAGVLARLYPQPHSHGGVGAGPVRQHIPCANGGEGSSGKLSSGGSAQWRTAAGAALESSGAAGSAGGLLGRGFRGCVLKRTRSWDGSTTRSCAAGFGEGGADTPEDEPRAGRPCTASAQQLGSASRRAAAGTSLFAVAASADHVRCGVRALMQPLVSPPPPRSAAAGEVQARTLPGGMCSAGASLGDAVPPGGRALPLGPPAGGSRTSEEARHAAMGGDGDADASSVMDLSALATQPYQGPHMTTVHHEPHPPGRSYAQGSLPNAGATILHQRSSDHAPALGQGSSLLDDPRSYGSRELLAQLLYDDPEALAGMEADGGGGAGPDEGGGQQGDGGPAQAWSPLHTQEAELQLLLTQAPPAQADRDAETLDLTEGEVLCDDDGADRVQGAGERLRSAAVAGCSRSCSAQSGGTGVGREGAGCVSREQRVMRLRALREELAAAEQLVGSLRALVAEEARALEAMGSGT